MISTFYIYADGNDLDDSAAEVRSRIETFVEPYRGRVRVVDQRADDVATELSDWDLGVNFEFESLTNAEKKDLLLFFHCLSADFGRDFIVGGALPHGLSEDFVSISAAESLERAIDLLTANEKNG